MFIEELLGIATYLYEAGNLDKLIEALETERLKKNSKRIVINNVFSGQERTQSKVVHLYLVWKENFPTFSAKDFSLLLKSISETISIEREKSTEVELVWTGPLGSSEFPRMTRQVVQDIINDSENELMIAGYWIAGQADGEGIVADIIELLVKAVERDVNLTMILDQNPKHYGGTNEEVIRELWNPNVELPKMAIWPDVSNGNHLKMHAKLIVGDQNDALVTSANLTMHALDKNIEMGVRLKGKPAQKIARHLESLIEEGILVYI
jgi:hypothetical protein